MARVNFRQLFFTISMKVKDNKKHHKVHLIIHSNLFSNFPGRIALPASHGRRGGSSCEINISCKH